MARKSTLKSPVVALAPIVTITTPSASTSAAAIDKAINHIRRSYETAQTRVQNTGLMIIRHAQTFGDCSKAKALVRAIPARERNSLIGWFQLYSPIGIMMGKDASEDKCRLTKPDSSKYNDYDLAGATANNWWNDPAGVNPEQKPLNTMFDFYGIIDKMLEREAENAMKDGKNAKYKPEVRAEVAAEATHLRKVISVYRAQSLARKNANPYADVNHDDPLAGTDLVVNG